MHCAIMCKAEWLSIEHTGAFCLPNVLKHSRGMRAWASSSEQAALSCTFAYVMPASSKALAPASMAPLVRSCRGENAIPTPAMWTCDAGIVSSCGVMKVVCQTGVFTDQHKNTADCHTRNVSFVVTDSQQGRSCLADRVLIISRTAIQLKPCAFTPPCYHEPNLFPRQGLIISKPHACHMLIDSSTLTPPYGNDYSFEFDALGNTSPDLDVSLFTGARSMLQNLDLDTKRWRRSSAQIDIASLGIVMQ